MAASICVIVAILTALSRILPATKPLWDRLGRYKLVPPIAIVAIGYALQGLTSGDWTSGLELYTATIVALLAPGLKDAVTVGSLLLVAVTLGTTGCAGSFEEARGAAAVSFEPAPRVRCESLSDRQAAFGAAEVAAASLAAPTGLVAIPVRGDVARSVLIGSAVVLTAGAAGAALVSDQAGKSYVAEGCAQ